MTGMQAVAVPPAPTFAGMCGRYGMPLMWLADDVAILAIRVEKHLKWMGASWK